MVREAQVDVLVIGAGIAGLWTLARLRAAGFRACGLAVGPVGRGQTIWSQGIVHGGVKYALGGEATSASRALAEMPERWAACLRGAGEIDLSVLRRGPGRGVHDRQMLWTTGTLLSRLAGLAASQAIRTEVVRLDPAERPPALAAAPRGVSVYSVAEPVLPVRDLLRTLAGVLADSLVAAERIIAIDAGGRDGAARVRVRAEVAGSHVEWQAARVVLAAGAGVPGLLTLAGLGGGSDAAGVGMQRRPLHMGVARGPLPELCGHCLGSGSTPRLTITTPVDDRSPAGERTWLIGGQVAEEGVARGGREQAEAVRAELAACLPWIDLSAVRIATGRVDRAEARTADGRKPDGPVVESVGDGRLLVAWPTKLAFAPLLADRVLDAMTRSGVAPRVAAAAGADEEWPRPEVAEYPWDEAGAEWFGAGASLGVGGGAWR